MKAPKRFEQRGYRFISYAVWPIRQAILDALVDRGRIVRLPYNQVLALKRISDEASRLEQELQRAPTRYELADALDLDEETLEETISFKTEKISLDASANPYDPEGRPLIETAVI